MSAAGIICPALKCEASPRYDPEKPLGPDNKPGSQGVVSWGICQSCHWHKGRDDTKYTIHCGYNQGEVIELKLLPE